MKTFAIIIPTYNEQENIEILLSDIKKQSLQPNEVIVADAHSKDCTRQIAERLGALVVDGGLPGPGRNAGARVATSDILFFMDADVRLFDQDFFRHAVSEFLDRHLDSGTAELEPMSDRLDDWFGHWVYNRLLRLREKRSPYAAGSLIIATREAHDKIGGFDERIHLGEDTDYAMRISKVSTFRLLRSVRIPVSVRRLERDGRFATAFKYIGASIHFAILGPVTHKGFKYEFGYDHMKKNPPKNDGQ